MINLKKKRFRTQHMSSGVFYNLFNETEEKWITIAFQNIFENK